MRINKSNTLLVVSMALLTLTMGAAMYDHLVNFVEAAEHGSVEAVSQFLQDPAMTFTEDDVRKALYQACQYGHSEVVRFLLADPRVYPGKFAIRIAAKRGHSEVVKLLLADPRVDPAAKGNKAIIYIASYKGHSEIVKLLLADPRVDPAAEDNAAICVASQYGHFEVVRFLLADPRVYPGKFAIRIAAERGHFEVVRLLLADPRVNPSKVTTSKVAALFVKPPQMQPEIVQIVELAKKLRSDPDAILQNLEKLSDEDLDTVAFWSATRLQLSLPKDGSMIERDKELLRQVVEAQKKKLGEAWRPEYETILMPLMLPFPFKTQVLGKICAFLNYFWTPNGFLGLPSDIVPIILMMAYN